MNSILLSWPDRAAHPNARGHWSKRAKANKTMRRAAYYMAKGAGLTASGDAVHVKMTFFPPNRQRRDLDGCISSAKAYLDGIADALGVDDSTFSLSAEMSPQTGGHVCFEVRS